MGTNDFQDKTLECMLAELDLLYEGLYKKGKKLSKFCNTRKNPMTNDNGRSEIHCLSRNLEYYNDALTFASFVAKRRYCNGDNERLIFVSPDKDGKHRVMKPEIDEENDE